jgi:DNA-binding HxlR family transcriptional regulator
MTESTWKMVVDGDGVTISGDQFRLTTQSSDPGRLDMVVSELQSLTRGTYGQYCGLTRAIEMIGERWGLLIIRDLLVSSKTAAELHRGLPRIPMMLLQKRLKEMIYSGVVRQVDDSDRYELTEYGRALEEAVLALGRWGAMALNVPRPEDVITEDSLVVALRATYLAEHAGTDPVSYEIRVGDMLVHAEIEDGRLTVDRGPLPGADVTINPGPMFKALLAGDVTAAEALASGQVEVTGDPALFERFVATFKLPNIPVPEPARA